MYASNEPSSWEVVPAAEDSAADSFANDGGQEMLTATEIHGRLDPEVEGQLDSGFLMSFLSDFRSAEYEQVRKQREEELAKTRKRRPVPRQQPEDDETVEYSDPEAYFEPAVEAEQAEYSQPAAFSEPEQRVPAQPESQEQWAPQRAVPPTQLNAGDFLSAASQPQSPGRKFRLPFGISGSKTVRESPATT